MNVIYRGREGLGSWSRVMDSLTPPRIGRGRRLILFIGVTAMACAAPAAELVPGETFQDCRSCPEMIVVPGGTFLMGSTQDEVGREADVRNHDEDDIEGPGGSQVKVTIPSFAVGVYEVTNREFAAFVEDTSYDPGDQCIVDPNVDGEWNKNEGNAGHWTRTGRDWLENQPVTCIDWNDAAAYTDWLSLRTGATYRLLSEAQFEYALRAGSTSRYHFGDRTEDWCVYGNVMDAAHNSRFPDRESISCDDGYVYMAPVGQFKPNAFGIHDMSGNVWEWLLDCYDRSYADYPRDGSARDADGCTHRSLRGNSWGYDIASLRSADRSDDPVDLQWDGIGMRVMRELAPQAYDFAKWQLSSYQDDEIGVSLLYPSAYEIRTQTPAAFSVVASYLVPRIDVYAVQGGTVDAMVGDHKEWIESQGGTIESTVTRQRVDASEFEITWTTPDSVQIKSTMLTKSHSKRAENSYSVAVVITATVNQDWGDLSRLFQAVRF